MELYKVKHNGVVHEFKELCDAWNYADKHGLKRCPRLKEKEVHPYFKGITKGGELVNARPE